MKRADAECYREGLPHPLAASDQAATVAAP
jgi:hypothetical protein